MKNITNNGYLNSFITLYLLYLKGMGRRIGCYSSTLGWPMYSSPWQGVSTRSRPLASRSELGCYLDHASSNCPWRFWTWLHETNQCLVRWSRCLLLQAHFWWTWHRTLLSGKYLHLNIFIILGFSLVKIIGSAKIVCRLCLTGYIFIPPFSYQR